MNAEILLPWCVSITLLAVRLSIAVALSPALSAYGIPATVRVASILVLAVLTFAERGPIANAATWAADPVQLLLPIAAEVFIGALLGLGVHLVLGALSLAGRLMDVQAGFAIGAVFDPVTRTNANVLGSLLSLLGVTIFFATDAHLQVAGLLAQSVDVVPLGELPSLQDPLQPVLAAGAMFASGIALAAPVSLALFLSDVAIGVASRNMPKVNVLVLAMPIKALVSYLVLAMTVRGWAPILRQSFGDMTALAGVR